MRDELFYDEVLALCRARRELGMAQQALDVLKAKYARAKKAERHAHRALVDASLKWVAQGNNPARLPRGIGFSRRERMDYDADEMLAQAMARGAEDLFVLPPPRLKRADFAAQARELPWAKFEMVNVPTISVRLDPRAVEFIVQEADRLEALAGDETGELPRPATPRSAR